ncbi:uncharacterized protein PITG_18427 [Phytophthora infestans T30-4]|uniref:Uncharacterized protein n=1 Tax=Phytophthora infestans (strain T30-4) TaxID=403677 RepID=D0NX01_PHYIT|nr:uncharacterized protein PITG_18427 [Phytophthora infestans T30-4]EEY67593.1 conserved hypothetical protein [Phytophthora infestans T30-4]|eukprot:XP_002896358.1 conserved hypothetical protein [Phytophthora infestans T30-4]
MCCSAVFLKRDFDVCRICGGQHIMTERRLQYTSKSCSGNGNCLLLWKVFTCSAQDTRTIWVNHHGHVRGVFPCSAAHPHRITLAMKTFLAAQDEIGIPPRLIMVNLKRQENMQVTSRGWPDLKQIRNAPKRIRREQGSKNSRKSIQDLLFCLDLRWTEKAMPTSGPGVMLIRS